MRECYVDRDGLSTKIFIVAPQNKIGKPAPLNGISCSLATEGVVVESRGPNGLLYQAIKRTRQISVRSGADVYGPSPLTSGSGS